MIYTYINNNTISNVTNYNEPTPTHWCNLNHLIQHCTGFAQQRTIHVFCTIAASLTMARWVGQYDVQSVDV